MEVRVQSIVVEFILTHVDQLFGGAALSGQCLFCSARITTLGRHARMTEDLKVQLVHFLCCRTKTELQRDFMDNGATSST